MKPQEATTAEKPIRTRRSAGVCAGIFFLKLGILAASIWICCTVVLGIFVCHDNAASPMIQDGDLCLTDRLSEPAQGDAVAYVHADRVQFGRVIAVSGETVNLVQGTVQVDGCAIPERTEAPTPAEGSRITFPYTVPQGCVFLLNDNRALLNDSRSYGAIPKASLRGCVILLMRRRGI